MLTRIKIFIAFLVLIFPMMSHALCVSPTSLNGVWKANDGGTYYMSQRGNTVWWVGMSSDNGKTWTNVYKGQRQGNYVYGQWADVPRGKILSGGTLNLYIDATPQGYIRGVSRAYVTGGFGGSSWFKDCQDVVLNPVPG